MIEDKERICILKLPVSYTSKDSWKREAISFNHDDFSDAVLNIYNHEFPPDTIVDVKGIIHRQLKEFFGEESDPENLEAIKKRIRSTSRIDFSDEKEPWVGFIEKFLRRFNHELEDKYNEIDQHFSSPVYSLVEIGRYDCRTIAYGPANLFFNRESNI